MPTTSKGLRYPALSGAPNVPADMQALAEDVDAALGTNVVKAADVTATESTTSTAYASLTTVQSLALTVGPLGRVWVSQVVDMIGAVGVYAIASHDIYRTSDGVVLLAASDMQAILAESSRSKVGAVSLHTGLVAGTAVTVRARFRSSSGASVTFRARHLMAWTE